MRKAFLLLMFKTQVSARGEIVIPKHIREELGITRNTIVFLELNGKTLELRAGPQDPIKVLEDCAKRANVDVSKWVMGDKLYEEVF